MAKKIIPFVTYQVVPYAVIHSRFLFDWGAHQSIKIVVRSGILVIQKY